MVGSGLTDRAATTETPSSRGSRLRHAHGRLPGKEPTDIGSETLLSPARSVPRGFEAAVQQKDDHSAYKQLYEAHHRTILAYCVRRVGRNEAPDLVSEVFTVAWRRLDSIPPGDEAVRWLYGVAFRVVSDHRRGARRRRRLEARARAVAPEADAGPELEVVQRHEYDLVIQAASHLRPLDQEVLRLALWEELSHTEIADILGSSIPAIRQRFHRAKRALAKHFEKLGGTVPQGDASVWGEVTDES